MLHQIINIFLFSLLAIFGTFCLMTSNYYMNKKEFNLSTTFLVLGLSTYFLSFFVN